VKAILSLPFAIYHTFVIEERFGFNKTKIKTFVADIAKGLSLAVLLGGPLLAGILWFFSVAGDHAWWLCWIGVSLFMLAVQFVAPTWIMPIFNKFTPLENSPLRTAIFDYARGIQFPLENVFVMDGSRRSTKPNSFFTGFGKHKRIVLFDTLIKDHTDDELVSVLAHEVGHYKKKHTLSGTILSLLQMGLMLYILSLFIGNPVLSQALGATEGSFHMGVLAFMLLYSPLSMVLGLIMNAVSRKNEFTADRYAGEHYDPEPLKKALKKLSVNHLSNLTPHPVYVFFHYSHPPLLQRLKALDKIPSDGSLN
jgi:STE24 endopeptidase